MTLEQDKPLFARIALISLISIGFAVSVSGAVGAQTWAWAVYHDGRGTLLVARMETIASSSGWSPLAPYTNQTQRDAQQAACLLATVGDLRNRKYRAPQIASREWRC